MADGTQEAGEIRTAQIDLEQNVNFSNESEMPARASSKAV